MVHVRFVGSGDAFGSGGRFQTCIHLQAGGHTLLLDCGATSLTALKAQQLDPNAIDTVVLSHLHVDHFGGVPLLILDGQFTRRTTPLTVAGPAGTAQRLSEAMEVMFPGSSSVQRRFDVTVLELDPAAPTTVADATIQSWPVDHGINALAHRLTLGSTTVAYTGDTAWTDALTELAAGTDLFIAEAYFWDKPVPYHLRHADLLEHADQLASTRTILTHMSTDMLAHANDAVFALAYDGLSLTL
jgi:ribonuclease BN (tRNA processing enzyme)